MSHTQGLLYAANTGLLFFFQLYCDTIDIYVNYSYILQWHRVGGGELSHTEKLLHVTVLETPYTH